MTAMPIETHYAGCRFRSRLEARWAVFFDVMDIPWEYEPQGFTLSNGARYLPDFLLPECGTWIEVKGTTDNLNTALLCRAAEELPTASETFGERGAQFMLLGPIPAPKPTGDYGWNFGACGFAGGYGFGGYYKNKRPWGLDCGTRQTGAGLLAPYYDEYGHSTAQTAYRIARCARFEHGESG